MSIDIGLSCGKPERTKREQRTKSGLARAQKGAHGLPPIVPNGFTFKGMEEKWRAARRAAAERCAAELKPVADILSAAVAAPVISSGIYFLIRHGHVRYVGMSVDVLGRVLTHKRTGRRFDSWDWVPCEPQRLEAMERAYIDALCPAWNKDPETSMRRTLAQRVEGRERMRRLRSARKDGSPEAVAA